jgi:hypothetical protein
MAEAINEGSNVDVNIAANHIRRKDKVWVTIHAMPALMNVLQKSKKAVGSRFNSVCTNRNDLSVSQCCLAYMTLDNASPTPYVYIRGYIKKSLQWLVRANRVVCIDIDIKSININDIGRSGTGRYILKTTC